MYQPRPHLIASDLTLHHRQCIGILKNKALASCPWGPVTANGVNLLTEINAMSVGPMAVAGRSVTDARKARKYIQLSIIRVSIIWKAFYGIVLWRSRLDTSKAFICN